MKIFKEQEIREAIKKAYEHQEEYDSDHFCNCESLILKELGLKE